MHPGAGEGGPRRFLAFSRKQVVEPRVIRLEALIEDLSQMLVRLSVLGTGLGLATIYGAVQRAGGREPIDMMMTDVVMPGIMERNLHFFGKPFSIQDLSRKIREVLDGGR